jgi:hypothetical protein
VFLNSKVYSEMYTSATQNSSTSLESVGAGLELFFIVPELMNLTFLLLGIYGMYKGIEIQHPLYAIIFFNLIVPLISTVINITVFGFVSLEIYLNVSSLTSAFSVYFHGMCWMLSSLIQYLYIMHNDWLFSKFPDVKKQCWIALGLEITLTILLMTPVVWTAVLLGSYAFEN